MKTVRPLFSTYTRHITSTWEAHYRDKRKARRRSGTFSTARRSNAGIGRYDASLSGQCGFGNLLCCLSLTYLKVRIAPHAANMSQNRAAQVMKYGECGCWTSAPLYAICSSLSRLKRQGQLPGHRQRHLAEAGFLSRGSVAPCVAPVFFVLFHTRLQLSSPVGG